MNKSIYLALSFSLLASFSALEAFADDDESVADSRLEKAEQLLLGKPGEGSVDSRMDALEMSLYGKTKHGKMSKRLDAVSDFLGVKAGASSTASADRDKAAGDVNSSAAEPTKSGVEPSIAKAEFAKPGVEPTTASAEFAKSGVEPTTANSRPAKSSFAMPPQAPSFASAGKPELSSQARELLRQGMRQFSSGQYISAEDTFRRVLSVDPRNADAFYNLGSLAERRHDYVIALTNYRAALNLNASDKEYLTAVEAMEHQLAPSVAHSGGASNPGHATKTATVGHFRVPVDAATANSPLMSVGSPINGGTNGQPFQLSGTKNDLIMNTTQFTNNYGPTMTVSQPFAPTMTVNQPGPPPTMGVAQQPPKSGGGFGKVLNVGMRAALYSSGLHCPICRMMGGGFHF